MALYNDKKKKKDQVQRLTDTGTGNNSQSKPQVYKPGAKKVSTPGAKKVNTPAPTPTPKPTTTTATVAKPGVTKGATSPKTRNAPTRQTDTGTRLPARKKLPTPSKREAPEVSTTREQRLSDAARTNRLREERRQAEQAMKRYEQGQGDTRRGANRSNSGFSYKGYVAQAKAEQYNRDVQAENAARILRQEQHDQALAAWDLGAKNDELAGLRKRLDDAWNSRDLSQQIHYAYTHGDKELAQRLAQKQADAQKNAPLLAQQIQDLEHDLKRAKALQYSLDGADVMDKLRDSDAGAWDLINSLAQRTGYTTRDTGDLPVAPSQNGTFDIDPNMVAALTAEDDETRALLKKMGYSDKDIEQLTDYRIRQINRENYERAVAQAQQFAQDNPVGASVVSVGTNIGAGLGFVDSAVQKLRNPDRPVDYYSDSNLPSAYTNAIRGQVSQDLIDKYGEKGKIYSFLYQSGMSMADSGVNMLLSAAGIPEVVGLMTLAGSAATSSMKEAHDRGLSDSQALGIGLIAGAAEYGTEKIGLDAFMGTVFKRSKGSHAAARALLTNVFAEGGEEVASDVINLAADILISKDKSEWEQSIQRYRDLGFTDSEAFGKALGDQARETGLSFLGGALSGGVMGGGGLVLNHLIDNHTEELLYAGYAAGEGTGVNAAAQDLMGLQRKLSIKEQAGEKLTEDDQKAYTAAVDQLKSAMDALDPEVRRDLMKVGRETRKEMARDAKAAKKAAKQVSRMVKETAQNQRQTETTETVEAVETVENGSTEAVEQPSKPRYSDNATVQQAAELVAEGRTSKAVTTVMQNAEAQAELGLDFSHGATNTERRTAIKTALESLVQEQTETPVEVNNSTEASPEVSTPAAVSGGTETETVIREPAAVEDSAEEDTAVVPDQMISYETFAKDLREGNPDVTEEESRALYKEVQQVVEASQYATERAGQKVYLQSADRVVDYKEFREMAQAEAKRNGATYEEAVIRDAFDTAFRETQTGVQEHETRRREKLNKTAENINKAFDAHDLGFRVRVSYDGADFAARGVKENAFVDVKNHEIVFNGDVMDSSGAMLWYLGHEVFHPAADVDTELVDTVIETFQKLLDSDKLTGRLAAMVRNVDAQIARTRELYQRHENELAEKAGRKAETISEAQAREEFAADLMRYAFSSTQLCKDIVGQKPTVAMRMRQAVSRVLKTVSGGDDSDTSLRDELQKLADRLDAALNAVALNSSRKVDPESGKPVELGVHQPGAEQYSICGYEMRDYKPDVRLSSSDFELRLAKKGGAYVYLSGREVLAQLLAKNGVSDEVASKVLDYMDSAADFMRRAGVTYRNIGLQDVNNAKIEVRMDEDGSPISFVLSAMVKNGEYPVNFDLTQICKRREALSKYLNKLLADHPFSTFSLDRQSLQQLAKILSEEGYDTACLGCFVEAKRFYMEEFVTKFVDKWNAAVKKINPDAGYFGFSEVDTEVTDKMVGEADELLEAWRAANTKTKNEKTARNQAMAERLRTEGITDEVIADIIASNEEGHRVLEIEQRDNPDAKFKTAKYVSDSVVRDLKAGKLPSIKYVIEHVYSGSEANNTEKVENLVATGEVFQKLLTPEDLLTTHGLLKFTKLSSALPGLLSGSYGSGAPKLAQGFVPYNNEIAYLPDTVSKKSLNEYLQGIAGLRSQSFSDFKIENVFDYLQMIADLTARGLPAHMYTKEIACARILGMCGVKVNMSVMFTVEGVDYWGDKETAKKYAGLRRDKNGNLVYSFADRAAREARLKEDGKEIFVQSIDVDDAMELQKDPDYSPYVGIIGVGYGDLHIRMMLRDDNFRYVIPYHRSGLPVEIRDLTNLDLAENYTDTQNTMKFVVMETVDGKKQPVDLKRLGVTFATADEFLQWVKDNGYELRTTKAFGGHGDFDLYGDLARTQDPKQTAKNYQQWCWDQGLLPLFYQFMDEDNYYKLLYDFAVTDAQGNYAPQENVHLWDEEGNITGMKKNAFTEKGLVGREMAAQNERNEELYSPEKVERVAQRMYDTVRYDSEPQFSISREMDTEYLELAKDPVKNAARLQELVDEAARRAGYPLRLMHGTNSFGFTTVEFGQSDDSISFFATDSEEVAGSYVRPVSDESGEPSTYVRPIARPTKTRLTEKSGAADILAQLKKLAPETYEDMRVATEQQLKQIADETFSYVKELAAKLDRYSLPARLQTMAQQVMQAKTAQEAVNLVESVSDVNEIIYNGMVFVQAEGALENLRAFTNTLKAQVSMTPQNTAIRENDGRIAPVAATSLYEDYLDLTGMSGRGIYDIYTTANNPLVVDCRDGWWDNIRLTGEIAADLGERATTREIAKWAHEHNYGTVIFENVHDTGMYGSRFTPASTVYAFLKDGNNSFKSADPVTYDNNGNIIPLSQRFDSSKQDIRFSIDTLDTDGRELSAGQLRYFRNSKIVDAYGHLLRMYHGTTDFGFTVFDTEKSEGALFFTSSKAVARSYSGTKKNDVYSVDRLTDLSKFSPHELTGLQDAAKVLKQHGYTIDLSRENTLRKPAITAEARALAKEYADLIAGYYEAILGAESEKIRKEAENFALDKAYAAFQQLQIATDKPGLALLSFSKELNQLSQFAQTICRLSEPGGLYPSWASARTEALGIGTLLDDAETEAESLRHLGNAQLNSNLAFTVFDADGNRLVMTAAAIENLAENLMQQSTSGLYAVYLNITNPLVIDCRGCEWNELSFDDLLDEMDDIEREDFLDRIGDGWEGSTTRDVAEYAKDNGYDGVLFLNLVDIGGLNPDVMDGGSGRSDIAIAFSSEQAKSVTNENPTSDPDIRFSIENVDGETMAVTDFSGTPSTQEAAEKYLEGIVGSPEVFARTLDGATEVYLGEDLPGEYAYSKNSRMSNFFERLAKMKAVTVLDEMILLGENGRWSQNAKDHHGNEAKYGWTRYDTTFGLRTKKSVKVYDAVVLLRNDADGKTYLYDITNVKQKKTVPLDTATQERSAPDNAPAILGTEPSSKVQYTTEDEKVNREYSLTDTDETDYDPNDDPMMQAFFDAYEEAHGEGQTKIDYPTLNQRLRAAERARKKAEVQLASEQAKRSLAEAETKDNRLAWQIYAKKMLRTKDREYRAKMSALRREKMEAVKAAVQQTREVERATAAVKLDEQKMAERMNAGRKQAAMRQGVREDTYARKAKEQDNAKLRRNAAKAALRNKNLAEKKREKAEIEQGPVSTLRKTAKERKAMENRQNLGQKLRTKGRALYRDFVNKCMAIDFDVSRRQRGGMKAGTLATIVGSVGSTTETMFTDALVDRAGNRIGESMTRVFLCTEGDKGKVIDENRQRLLQDYMLHRHNIDRMSIVANTRARLEAFEAENPWLSEMDGKEFARLVALTDKEAEKSGQTRARELARQYGDLLQEFNEARDKPVFPDQKGNPVTAETSREKVEQYEAENPWLKDKAEGIYKWWDSFMRAWVVGDSITEEQYDRMRELYPHYVPTYRVDKGGMGFSFTSSNGATPGQLVKKATGSLREIVNIEDSFANLVAKAVKQARVNELYKNLVDTAMLDSDGVFADCMFFDWLEFGEKTGARDLAMLDVGEQLELREKAGLTKDGSGYRVSAWYDGELVPVYVSEDLFQSLSDTVGASIDKLDKVARLGSKLTAPMKTAITGINPNFALRNVTRDLPTAIINSTSGLAFPVYWAKAWKHMLSNSEHWQRYNALGGGNALYYNTEGGFGKNMNMEAGALGSMQRGWDKFKTAIGVVNESTEAVTRFAEYLATVERQGDTYEARLQGIKNAAEVTVDFSRHGRYGKAINAWIPYWNPAVQGIDKVIRSVVETPEGQTKVGHALRTLGRAAVTTALLDAVMQLIYNALGKRDDWDELDDRTKDTYYCIPTGDHTFLKIPKNREWGAILGTPLMRLIEGYNGRENPFENYIETSIIPNFLPGMPTDMIGFSQYIDLATNKDFAGRTIVPYAYQQGSKAGQYDSETSALSHWLSDRIGNAISPMQLDYIIKDYFGDFGKMFTMATSEGLWSGEKSPEEVADYALDIVKKPWEADNRFSNQYTSRYYETISQLEATYKDKKNHSDGESYKDSVEYRTSQAMTKLYGNQISEISKSLRDETNEEIKAAGKAQIVQLAKQALAFYDDCMTGKVSNPELTAAYSDLPGSVSEELIRLNGLAKEYKFQPTASTTNSYVDPTSKVNNKATREYVLDDEAKAKLNGLREEHYVDYFQRVINTQAYKSASDTGKAELLEEARDNAYEDAKEEFMEWLFKNRKPTPKK